MIKRLETLLNIVHYCLYKLDYKLHLLSNKINPFLLLGTIPALKRKFEEQGTTLKAVVNKIWGDKRSGFAIMISGGGFVTIVLMVVWPVFLMLNNLLKQPITFILLPFAICCGLSYLISHFTVFQKDKYILYFKQFDKWPYTQKLKYAIISLAFIVGTIILFIYSFKLLPTQN